MAEQRRLSLEARRANHAFLTQPIARQAQLVVAPEYNRFASVLAKPVRPGLDALARGSPRARSHSPSSGSSRRPAPSTISHRQMLEPPAGFESLAAFNKAFVEPFGR